MQIQQTTDGDYFYPELPPGWKRATLSDFYNHDHLIINLPYLIHSEMDPSKYYGKRTNINFPFPESDFALFLQKGRVYVEGDRG